MAISDLDIYRAAKLLITQHGENAELEAGRMFDVMTDKSDIEGRQVWRRICAAIKDLDSSLPDKRMM